MKRKDAAMALAVKGWKLFTLSPNGKVPSRSMTDWERKATDDTDELSRLFGGNPGYNLGVATGPSGLVVLDFDTAKVPQEKSGIEHFREAFPNRRLTATYTVRTASGGWHLYYRAPEGKVLRNTAGRLAPKVDTRAQGGYVVGPGSVIDGSRYEVTNNVPVAPLPEWIVDELGKVPEYQAETVQPKGSVSSYAAAALRAEVAEVSGRAEGGRNHATNRAAWNLSRFVVKGELSEEEILDKITEASVESGLSHREARNAVVSGLTRGMRHFKEKS